jgi:hypothetical protein
MIYAWTTLFLGLQLLLFFYEKLRGRKVKGFSRKRR